MIYVFDDYELDISRYELRLEGEPLQIEPKVFDLLAYLVQHHGQFVSKDDLHAHLWTHEYVGESALTYCIRGARKAVNDDGRTQRIIKTVYGRGYRFIAASVEERDTDTAARVVTDLPIEASASEKLVELERSFTPPSLEDVDNRLLSPENDIFKTERRHLTVMWCRIVASPVRSEQVDPEELYEVLEDILTGCTEVIRHFAGHVSQHLGDEFMVYFGHPYAHEDDAHRAIHTGLEIVRQIGHLKDRLEQERDLKLSARVGIHTSLVVMDEVINGDKCEWLALGDAPRIAVQLPGFAGPNIVVISSAVLKLVEGYFVCEVLGSHVLEDLPQPLEMYQVLRPEG